MRAHHIIVLALCACGTNDSMPGGEPPLDPGAPEGGQQVASETYHLPPGKELYMCYQFYSPDDAIAVTKAESISMLGVHHLALFTAFGRNEPDEAHECPELIKETWMPLYVTGTGSKSITTPSGVGFPIAGHTQYILQLHLQNTTDGDLDVRAGVNLTYDHNPSALQPAGIWAAGRQDLTIPPNAIDYQVKEPCQASKPRHVFAVFPHMHKLGTAMRVTVTKNGTLSDYYAADPWEFGNQPIEMIQGDLDPTDMIEVTCHWTNPSAAPVVYGESSDNEMCYFVTFYYPFEGLDGCID